MTTTNAIDDPPPEAEPDPVTEVPPEDRFCDLVITGGVASGVVYPWAIVELARHYRFRNIGGTSIGAVAAALAAASEYGRCRGVPAPFEVLRRVPGVLAERPKHGDAATKMLSLFQPRPEGARLWKLTVELLTLLSTGNGSQGGDHGDLTGLGGMEVAEKRRWAQLACRVLRAYALAAARRVWLFLAAVVVLVVLAIVGIVRVPPPHPGWLVPVAATAFVVLGALFLALLVWGLVRALEHDVLEGVVANDLGFCSGKSADPQRHGQAFVEWMHEGIQKAAGLRDGDPPLTFADLWHVRRGAESYRSAARGEIPKRDRRSINLELMVSDVTHGRPYRLPLVDKEPKLYFLPSEWKRFFPASVMDELLRVSRPYQPLSPSDPERSNVDGLLEMPAGELPIVVAARMSMSFPVLFSAVPVYAVDYESERKDRALRPCRLSDGGLCSNFPIHLFDAAMPRWPTFGLWLSKRLQRYQNDPVWLPDAHLGGRADSWQRFEPLTQTPPDTANKPAFGTLLGFLIASGLTMKDWSDRTRMVLPQVRNRVARLALLRDEGQLHIAMPSRTILRMAHRYGTTAGRKLVETFAGARPPGDGPGGWREHQYVRLLTLLTGLRELLDGAGRGADWRGHTEPIEEVIALAARERPLRERPDRRNEDATGKRLEPDQAKALRDCVEALRALEPQLLEALRDQPYRPQAQPELRLRPPI